MPDLSLPDVTLHYEIDGSGPPLLLLAGMLSDSATWGPLVPLLTDHFTVIRPDNRSTGRTKFNGHPVTCAAMATDALALMDHLGHDSFHCAGHSLGGLLTLELASAAPDRVSTVTVLASGRIRSMRTLAMFQSLLKIRGAAEGEEMWLRALYPWVFGDAFFRDPGNIDAAIAAATAYPHAQTADNMAQQIEAFGAFRPKAKLERITMPCLVLYAGQDILVDPVASRASFDRLPDATHHTIPEAGHSIVWDATLEVADRMKAFIAG